MTSTEKCPPLSLTTQWEFWAWTYNLKRNNKQGKKK